MVGAMTFGLRSSLPYAATPLPLRPAHIARHRTRRSLSYGTVVRPSPLMGETSSIFRKPLRRGDLHVRQAILGVGAPEAVLVVVVALVVFGPKGLAEAARSLGAMLRSLTPTIRELADVSTDLKSTLEQEIGLDDIKEDIQSAINPTTPSLTEKMQGSGVEEDPDIEAKRAEAAQMAWGKVQPDASAEVQTGSAEMNASQKSAELTELSTEALEAELKRRKKAESETASG